ncbi:hypothetical protein FNV43_RR13716 [Rhamnella rubrinervis]|uniref:DUF7787 domain-containing protein n=1 Tax=Rhamnella rubrinervis TaxID=2594499 RepID=A0A8K0H1J3_9ROSA|nr:hypothetical protein FNV43_RR13716 [Rhamnella rubrinervis]
MDMENCKAKPKASCRKLSLEDYITFFIQSDSHFSLTVNQLNQIISMHGYKKIHKTPKKFLSDAVDKLRLMDPSRSTVEYNFISPIAFTSLEDVILDLKDLNWQECCVTSIETLSSSSNKGHVVCDEPPPLQTVNLQQMYTDHQPQMSLPPSTKAPNSKVNDGVSGGPSKAVKMGPRSKRKRSSDGSGGRSE